MSEWKKYPIVYKDFSTLNIVSEEQLQLILDSVPRQELRSEEWEETERNQSNEYPYEDPTPSVLRYINLEKLYWRDTDWRMITDERPSTEKDERFFSRLVELEKFRLFTKAVEMRRKKRMEDDLEEGVLEISEVSYRSYSRECLEDEEEDQYDDVEDQIDDGQHLQPKKKSK
ncbi:uncharacterized protein [Centruroides vittatus]|uniref:uncharacterized protein n=1 Tax=Centruroides vittatus TaxID=120091 RepID=UPI00350EB7CD